MRIQTGVDDRVVELNGRKKVFGIILQRFLDPKVVKLFYGRNLRVFVFNWSFPSKPFQPSLMLAGKAGTYLNETLQLLHTGRLLPYKQTLD